MHPDRPLHDPDELEPSAGLDVAEGANAGGETIEELEGDGGEQLIDGEETGAEAPSRYTDDQLALLEEAVGPATNGRHHVTPQPQPRQPEPRQPADHQPIELSEESRRLIDAVREASGPDVAAVVERQQREIETLRRQVAGTAQHVQRQTEAQRQYAEQAARQAAQEQAIQQIHTRAAPLVAKLGASGLLGESYEKATPAQRMLWRQWYSRAGAFQKAAAENATSAADYLSDDDALELALAAMTRRMGRPEAVKQVESQVKRAAQRQTVPPRQPGAARPPASRDPMAGANAIIRQYLESRK